MIQFFFTLFSGLFAVIQINLSKFVCDFLQCFMASIHRLLLPLSLRSFRLLPCSDVTFKMRQQCNKLNWIPWNFSATKTISMKR